MATPNSLFAVLHVSNAAHVESKLPGVSPWLYNKLQDGQWLLIAPSGTTTKEVCDKLGIALGESNGIVLKVDTYFGWNPPSLWEWIAAKQGAELGNAASA